MTEGQPKPSQQAIERATGSAPELPIREVFKLPSQAILEGIWQGRIRNPEALRGYFLRERTEFLQAHPDREDELNGSGKISRRNQFVYSYTAAEYNELAAFADSEVHRRAARLSGNQVDNPSYLQGVANFRHMAESWRQRAARLAETEPEHQPLPALAHPTPVVSELTPDLTVEPQRPTGRPDYTDMQDYQVLAGINNGTLTDTEAVHVYVSKSLDSARRLYEGEERSKIEAEYAEVVYGAPEDMIRFCLRQASEHMAHGVPGTRVSPAGYKIASRWYAMAGRFAEEAAREHGDEENEPLREP